LPRGDGLTMLRERLPGFLKDLMRPAALRYEAWRDKPSPDKLTYALNGLDRALERWLDIDGGVFIEAGANDGIFCSNTLYFERNRGWTGLLVEPIPELAERCRRNRGDSTGVALCALGGPDQAGGIVPLTFCNLMSIVDGAMGGAEAERDYIRSGKDAQPGMVEDTYTVFAPVVTLSSLIDRFEMKRVDLLVLDVEGYERQALAGLDLARHRPRFILVEALFHEEDIRRALADHYEFVTELGHKDLLFRARESLS
jgi:FkbM family methyltransferase